MHPSHHPIFCGGQDRAVPLWVLKGVIKATGAPWQSGAQGESGGRWGQVCSTCFLVGGKTDRKEEQPATLQIHAKFSLLNAVWKTINHRRRKNFTPQNRELLDGFFHIKMNVKPPSPFNSWVCLAGDRTFPAGEELRATLLLQLFATSVWWGFGMGQGGKSWKACCFCRFPL